MFLIKNHIHFFVKIPLYSEAYPFRCLLDLVKQFSNNAKAIKQL